MQNRTVHAARCDQSVLLQITTAFTHSTTFINPLTLSHHHDYDYPRITIYDALMEDGPLGGGSLSEPQMYLGMYTVQSVLRASQCHHRQR